MRVACIYVSLGKAKRSGATVSHRLASLLPGWEAFDDREVDYEDLRSKGYTVFLFNHKPDLFHRNLVPSCLEDIVNARSQWARTVIGRSCISGFSYWKRYCTDYKAFMPTVVDYRVARINGPPTLGYYSRGIRRDSDAAFTDLANRTPQEVPIVVMGSPLPAIRRPYEFTNSEDYFFSRVTHYFYWKSRWHDDVWPHTLLQAAQMHCVLVVPKSDRGWRDGIDDILDTCYNIQDFNKPWEAAMPVSTTWVPGGQSLLPLYEHILESKWRWLPDTRWTSFADVLNYSEKLR